MANVQRHVDQLDNTQDQDLALRLPHPLEVIRAKETPSKPAHAMSKTAQVRKLQFASNLNGQVIDNSVTLTVKYSVKHWYYNEYFTFCGRVNRLFCIPLRTQRCFDVFTTLGRRRMKVKTTSCAY